jgi:hypothetical protein
MFLGVEKGIQKFDEFLHGHRFISQRSSSKMTNKVRILLTTLFGGEV